MPAETALPLRSARCSHRPSESRHRRRMACLLLGPAESGDTNRMLLLASNRTRMRLPRVSLVPMGPVPPCQKRRRISGSSSGMPSHARTRVPWGEQQVPALALAERRRRGSYLARTVSCIPSLGPRCHLRPWCARENRLDWEGICQLEPLEVPTVVILLFPGRSWHRSPCPRPKLEQELELEQTPQKLLHHLEPEPNVTEMKTEMVTGIEIAAAVMLAAPAEPEAALHLEVSCRGCHQRLLRALRPVQPSPAGGLAAQATRAVGLAQAVELEVNFPHISRRTSRARVLAPIRDWRGRI